MLLQQDAWESAKYRLTSPVLSAFNTNSGDFAYPEYDTIKFPEWLQAAERGDYPTGSAHVDDYLESNARLVLWRVTERLVEDDAFAVLKMASPFMIGYGTHDQEETILRFLSWPSSV